MPRRVIDTAPFRFTEIQGLHRSPTEQGHLARLLRQRGVQPPRCEFALGEIPLIDLIESLLLDAHAQGHSTFDFDSWRAEGAPEAPLRAEFAGAIDAARERRPEDTPRLDNIAALYEQRADVDPLVAMESDRVLSSGDRALLMVDGRHRTFAAAQAGVDRLRVFVLVSADAVFSY